MQNTGNNVTNLGTDTNPSYEDFAYGGAGRRRARREHGRRPPERLVGRVQQLPRPVLAVRHADRRARHRAGDEGPDRRSSRKSDGADPYLGGRYGADPTRNGEPFGELGEVTQQDAAWGDQHGGPRDPQPGNSHASRDVHGSSGVLPIGSGVDPTPSYGGFIAPGPAPVVGLPLFVPTLAGPDYVNFAGRTSLTLTIGGPAGATASIFVTDETNTVAATATIGPGGTVTVAVDVSLLADGPLTALASVRDIMGHTALATSIGITNDTVAPNAPTVVLDPASDTGASSSDYVTNITSPVFIVTGETGATARVYVNGVLYTGQVLAAGSYVVTATLTDSAGNVSPAGTASNTLVISVFPWRPDNPFRLRKTLQFLAASDEPVP